MTFLCPLLFIDGRALAFVSRPTIHEKLSFFTLKLSKWTKEFLLSFICTESEGLRAERTFVMYLLYVLSISFYWYLVLSKIPLYLVSNSASVNSRDSRLGSKAPLRIKFSHSNNSSETWSHMTKHCLKQPNICDEM